MEDIPNIGKLIIGILVGIILAWAMLSYAEDDDDNFFA